jgi:outer membrane protein OmpA-like peptidoglycan-associated protein
MRAADYNTIGNMKNLLRIAATCLGATDVAPHRVAGKTSVALSGGIVITVSLLCPYAVTQSNQTMAEAVSASANDNAKIYFSDKTRIWRVDGAATSVLDDIASRLKAEPNANIVIVGYAAGEKAPMIDTGNRRRPMDLAAQRAVNAKAYLVQQEGIDPARIEVRRGAGKSEVADIDWIAPGVDPLNLPILEGTTAVDESLVGPSANAYPKPRTAAPAHHHKKGSEPAAGSIGGQAGTPGEVPR